jgi:hypothetical protein
MPSPFDHAAAAEAEDKLTLLRLKMIHAEAPPAPVNRPLAITEAGGLFSDSIDPKLRWYVPTVDLAPDPDPAFAFHADTGGVDADGRPFHKAKLTFTVQKSPPAAAKAWITATPGGTIREIPQTNLVATLSVNFKDPTTGQDEMTSYPIVLSPVTEPELPSDAWTATFNGVVGVGVIILYQNLTAGGAQISFSGDYVVFDELPPSTPTFVAITSPIYVATPGHWVTTFLVQRKFAADPYQLRYTLDLGGQTRPILSADDLNSFNFNQTEYMPLRQPGDVSARYPTIAALYLGVLSRRIVVVPARYAILRQAQSCAAVCRALVDSSPGLASGCKFQLEFTLFPDVSPIEMLGLAGEVAAVPELKDCAIDFPTALKPGPEALASAFATEFHYAEAAETPHGVQLSVVIREQAGGTPAVANVNLFLVQLRATREPFLTGAVGVKLDDFYPAPIVAPVVLSFGATREAGPPFGLTFRRAANPSLVEVVNDSAFDLGVARLAFLKEDGSVVVPLNRTIAKGKTLDVGLPPDVADLNVLSEDGLALGDSLTTSGLFQYLQLDTVDVQNTQIALSVNATGIDFEAERVAGIDVQIVLVGLPQVIVPKLSLISQRKVDDTRVQVPIGPAISDLAATVSCTVRFIDPSRPPVRLDFANDFAQHPIFDLTSLDPTP